ncbi:MAG: hypothetical protein LBI01_05760 [Elusimicrobium sp.]|jgi:hypothetical protein|nr:hypothetical protein [Elusimicrobium sp.]
MKKIIALIFVCSIAAAANAQSAGAGQAAIVKVDKKIAAMKQDSIQEPAMKAEKKEFVEKVTAQLNKKDSKGEAALPAVTDKDISNPFMSEAIKQLAAMSDEKIKALGDDKLISAVFKYKEVKKYCDGLYLKVNKYWNENDPESYRCKDGGKMNLEFSDEQALAKQPEPQNEVKYIHVKNCDGIHHDAYGCKRAE